MICSIVLLILVGVLLEGLPSLNVLAPLLIPIAGKLGLSELHYALVLIIAMGIGGFMPFAGVGFYVCCAVMRCDIETRIAGDAALSCRADRGTADRRLRAVVHAGFCRTISAFADKIRNDADRIQREDINGSQDIS